MQKRFFLSILSLSFFTFSCTKESSTSNEIIPVADFSFTFVGDNHHAPSSVNFSSTSKSSYSFSWNFGDGTSGTGETVSHKYTTEGTYTVTLTTTAGQKSSTKTQTVTILPAYRSVSINRIYLDSTSATSQFNGEYNITDNNMSTLYWTSNPYYFTINPSSLPSYATISSPVLVSNLSLYYRVFLTDVTNVNNPILLQQGVFLPSLYNDGESIFSSYPSKAKISGGFSLGLQWQ